MNERPGCREDATDDPRGGLGGFLRSLVAGIPWREGAETQETFVVPVPEGRALKVHNANGKTRVLGEDRADIEVRVQKQVRAETPEAAERMLRDIHVTSGVQGDALEIEVEIPGKWNRRGSANLEILVPRDVRVGVIAANGKVCLQGIRAAVHARSSNGSVSVSDVIGDISLHTANAKVSSHCTCGRLIARSSNGKIELGEHRGSVDASTSNGVIRAELDEVGNEGIVLATSNGRIVLVLPDEVDADVDMRVDNGVIRNDREIATTTGDAKGRVRGRMGRGGTPIKLRTSNGTISLR